MKNVINPNTLSKDSEISRLKRIIFDMQQENVNLIIKLKRSEDIILEKDLNIAALCCEGETLTEEVEVRNSTLIAMSNEIKSLRDENLSLKTHRVRPIEKLTSCSTSASPPRSVHSKEKSHEFEGFRLNQLR